jgi:predicted ATPase
LRVRVTPSLTLDVSCNKGTGKSTLVNQIKKPLQERGGCFIEGKFDKSARPDTILSFALNTFFGRVLAANAGDMHMLMRWRIHDAIGSGCNVLMEAIPNLHKLMSEGNSHNESPNAAGTVTSNLGNSYRLKFMFCKLIGAIACKNHPLVLFLDDLQWADDITLDVIRMIMTDPDVHHFLFIGAYRDNEANKSHSLTGKLNEMTEQGVNVVTIKVGPIEKECVNTLVSEALCLPPNLCRPLSTVIHSKTRGIIMFVLKFLESLNNEGLLWLSMSSRRWEFDLNKIRLKEISEDVVQHMTQHMTRLDKKIQMGLRLSACLGPNFDREILLKATKDDAIDLEYFIESCIENGFFNDTGNGQFVWAHDQVYQAAYELIPLAERESFHLLLGSRFFMRASPIEMETMIFFVVDNMNRGLKLIQCSDQKYDLSLLNLQAGEKGEYFTLLIAFIRSSFADSFLLNMSFVSLAIASSAFHSAVKYLMTGLSLLEHDSWERNYSLTIRLYDTASVC